MTRIDLTNIAYDARRSCFHATAILHRAATQRILPCRWDGPQTANFSRISQGLARSAHRGLT